MFVIILLLIITVIFVCNTKNENFEDSCNGDKINTNTCPNKSNNNFEKIMNTYQVHHQMGNPCDGFMSDGDFLRHMIPHHYVAIKMARNAIGSSTNQEIGYLLHKIIHNQYEEITAMNSILESFIPDLSSKDKMERNYITNTNEHWFPDEVTDKKSKCNKKAFNMAHKTLSGDITIKQFVDHMIGHHQVAVDMSKRILKYTQNPMIMSFAYGIVKDQQQEIWYMKGMSNQYN